MVAKYHKVGEQTYKLKQEQAITGARYEQLMNHPQRGYFYFTKASMGNYWLYVTNRGDTSAMSVTEKEQNQIINESYNKRINKSKDIDNLPIWN